MLNRIRISTTLFLILILCGVLQVGSNGLSFWAFRDGYQNLQEVETSNQQRSALAQTRAVLLQASTALNKAGTLTALSYPPEDIKALMVVARSSLNQADAQFKAFTAQEAVSEKEKALKVAMKKTFDVWYGDLDHQATWLENNQLSDFLTAPVQASQAAFDGSFNAWQQDINQFVARAGADSRTSYRMSGAIFLTMVILAALLTGGSLWWSRKMIVQPLAIVSSHFDSMAKGDLARPVAVYGRNEISAIFASLKAMQGSLRETVSNVRQGSYAMHTGISEIAAGNNDLSSRTEQQAASLAQTAASMEELTATVSQNADNARQASDLSKQAAMTAKRGGDQASHVASTMQEIAASSQKIGDIISVIDGIAFQTNILALNAAVEAARAGEQGRGFAVVASEVRTLASRSANAAKEIESLINESVSLIDQGSGEVVAAGNTMNEIVEAVKRVTDIMLEIAAASDEQSRGIVQVSQAISEMDKVTQQNASLVEEASAAAASLEEQGARLTEAVGAFRLNGARAERTSAAATAAKPAPLTPAAAVSGDNWETF